MMSCSSKAKRGIGNFGIARATAYQPLRALYILCAGLISFFVTGCATTAPTPEIICSQEYISERSSAAMREFSGEIRPALGILRSAAADFQNGKQLGSFRKIRILSALKSTVKKFEKSDALADIRLLASTCDDPELIERSIRSFLEEEGTPPVFLAFLDEVEQFRELTQTDE